MKFTKFLTGVGLFITLGTVGLCSHLATDNSDYMYLVFVIASPAVLVEHTLIPVLLKWIVCSPDVPI